MTSSVTVDFNANLARFTSGVDKAISDLNKFQSNAERISTNISRSFATLGVGLGVGAFAAFIKSSVDAQDHLNDLAKTTRLSVEQLAGLSSAAKKSGSDLDGTAKAINKLAVEMGKDAEKFNLLGITAKEPLQAFAQLADVMNAIDDPQKRAAVGAAALGKSWESSASLMAEGGKAIQEMIKHGTDLSKITADSAKAADELNDKWEDLKTTVSGWGVAVANPVVDGITKIIKALELEVGRKSGSIGEFLFGPKREYGYKGPLDKFGLPAAPGAGVPDPGKPGTPTASAVDRFIAGKDGKSGDTRFKQLMEQQKKRIAELNALSGDEQTVSVDSISRQYDKTLEDRAQALADAHEARMEQYRLETEGEGAVQSWIDKNNQSLKDQKDIVDKNNQSLKDQKDIAKDLGFTFSSAFEDAIVGGKDLSSVLQGLAQDVTRIFVRKTVTEPLGESLAGAFKGMGGGSGLLSGIKNMFTFDGGGYTGAGSRSGGLDGKGGFMAVLHPNETVTDHSKGGITGGVTIIQHINIDSRSDQGTIAAAMVQAKNAAVAEVHNAMRRGAWA